MTVVGPGGAAVFNLFREFRLKPGHDLVIPLGLVNAGGSAIDLNAQGPYTSFVGAGRREQNEVLTVSPLFTIATAFTGGGNGSDGLITMTIAGANVEQDTIGSGFYDIFGLEAGDTVPTLLVTGRWECVGATVDPVLPAADA